MRVLKYYVENKAQLETWKKVNENKVSYCKALRCETIEQTTKNCFPLCQTYKPTIIVGRLLSSHLFENKTKPEMLQPFGPVLWNIYMHQPLK